MNTIRVDVVSAEESIFSGEARFVAEGVALAREAIASGKALAKMHQFVARSKELAVA